jgi:hypothetical protein
MFDTKHLCNSKLSCSLPILVFIVTWDPLPHPELPPLAEVVESQSRARSFAKTLSDKLEFSNSPNRDMSNDFALLCIQERWT